MVVLKKNKLSRLEGKVFEIAWLSWSLGHAASNCLPSQEHDCKSAELINISKSSTFTSNLCGNNDFDVGDVYVFVLQAYLW